MKIIRKALNYTGKRLKKLYRLSIACLGLWSLRAFADDNPFPSITLGNNGNVIQASGQNLELALKYVTIGLGGILVLISLITLIGRMREDAREKEHGNLIMTFILITLGCTLGFILIAIGWKAFNTQIQT